MTDITEEPCWVYRGTAYNTKAQAEKAERYHLGCTIATLHKSCEPFA